MKKKKYVKPVLETEEFVPQEYCAACQTFITVGSEAGGVLVKYLEPRPQSKTNRYGDHSTVEVNIVEIGTVNDFGGTVIKDKLTPAYLCKDDQLNWQVDATDNNRYYKSMNGYWRFGFTNNPTPSNLEPRYFFDDDPNGSIKNLS